jgi:uncharacterized glyoxalase superfamily protein PhnB
MAKATSYVRPGYHSITAHLIVRGADEAIAYYKKVFGAQEIGRAPGPDGKRLMHAVVKIGDSMVMLADEFPEFGSCAAAADAGRAISLCLYVPDVDAVFERAVAAGAKPKMPPGDMFWGDRYSQIVDPFGQEWAIATHKEDLTPEETQQRQEAFFKQGH